MSRKIQLQFSDSNNDILERFIFILNFIVISEKTTLKFNYCLMILDTYEGKTNNALILKHFRYRQSLLTGITIDSIKGNNLDYFF